MSGEAVALAALGIMGSVVGVLIWLLKKLFGQNDTTLKDNNRALMKLSQVIDSFNHAIHEQGVRDKEYQEQLLGRLDDHQALLVIVSEKADRNYNATISQQTVLTQNVEHMHVSDGEK